MSEFINPYHFVPPLREPKSPTSKLAVCNTLVNIPRAGTAFSPDAAELLHDRYVPPLKTAGAVTESVTFSGRIDCTLRTESPCVFGNRHRKVKVKGEDTTIVENLQIDGKAAIAGTALKGMLSSIVEMASGSAMRVLGNHAMSIRSGMNESRSAMGMIIEREFEVQGRRISKRMLLPINLPNFKQERHQWIPVGKSATNEIWHSMITARPGLKRMPVYIVKGASAQLCFHTAFNVVDLPDTKSEELEWDERNKSPSVQQPQGNQFTKITDRGALLRPVKPLTIPKPKLVPADSSPTFPGIVRSLEKPSGSKDSTFDLFIPIDPRWRTAQNTFDFAAVSTDLLLDAENACFDFDSIVAHPLSSAVEERSATELCGQKKFKRLKKLKTESVPPQLRQGDLVYFTPKSATEVASLSISAIWREGVRWLWNEKKKDFSLLHHPDQRPMDPKRTQVTMAEKLFGWVMEGISDSDEQKPGELPNGYKGRVTVSDAVSSNLLTEVELSGLKQAPHPELKSYFPMPIQGSPKLPCPEFYFSGGTKKIRSELFDRTNSKIKLQGWKFYVIDPATIANDQPQRWKTSRPGSDLKQKSWIRPVKCGTEFKFHITFDNLTHEELQLLCYALKPDENFCHRLGYGRPVGLGVVSVQPGEIQLVNRRGRYTEEKNLLTSVGLSPASADTVSKMANGHALSIPEQHKVILLSGRKEHASPVSYPVKPEQNTEEKLYEWFVANREKNGEVRQRLTPLQPGGSIRSFKK